MHPDSDPEEGARPRVTEQQVAQKETSAQSERLIL